MIDFLFIMNVIIKDLQQTRDSVCTQRAIITNKIQKFGEQKIAKLKKELQSFSEQVNNFNLQKVKKITSIINHIEAVYKEVIQRLDKHTNAILKSYDQKITKYESISKELQNLQHQFCQILQQSGYSDSVGFDETVILWVATSNRFFDISFILSYREMLNCQ